MAKQMGLLVKAFKAYSDEAVNTVKTIVVMSFSTETVQYFAGTTLCTYAAGEKRTCNIAADNCKLLYLSFFFVFLSCFSCCFFLFLFTVPFLRSIKGRF